MKDREEKKAIQIRFPIWMYEKLKTRAKEERRTLNGEVCFALQAYIEAIAAGEKRNGTTAERLGGKANA